MLTGRRRPRPRAAGRRRRLSLLRREIGSEAASSRRGERRQRAPMARPIRPVAVVQTLVKRWSNADQTLIKRWSNAGQTPVKRRSNAGDGPTDPTCRSRSDRGHAPPTGPRARRPPLWGAGASPPQPPRASDRGREPAALVRRSSSPRSLSFHTRVVQKKSRLSRLSRAPGRAREKIRTREAIENSQLNTALYSNSRLNIAPPAPRGPGRASREGGRLGVPGKGSISKEIPKGIESPPRSRTRSLEGARASRGAVSGSSASARPDQRWTP